jgi:hypothetical protein
VELRTILPSVGEIEYIPKKIKNKGVQMEFLGMSLSDLVWVALFVVALFTVAQQSAE